MGQLSSKIQQLANRRTNELPRFSWRVWKRQRDRNNKYILLESWLLTDTRQTLVYYFIYRCQEIKRPYNLFAATTLFGRVVGNRFIVGIPKVSWPIAKLFGVSATMGEKWSGQWSLKYFRKISRKHTVTTANTQINYM